MEKRTNVLERNRWANELLKGLSKEEQIKWLSEKLASSSIDSEDELDLLEGLDTVFGDKVAFRKQLRHTYQHGEARSLKLATAIAKKILEGWDWEWGEYGDRQTPEYHKRAKRVLQMNPDARDCFQFFCQAYKLRNEQLQKFLMEVLHEHINAHRVRAWFGADTNDWTWRAEDLNEWILAEGVPSVIRLVLAGARIRIGGSALAQREISLSQSFQTQVRSPEAIALITTQMAVVRRTEELAQTLLERVRPTDQYGAPNPETVFTSHAEVEWKLESANVARVKITFHRAADPKSISDVQTVRDQLLGKIENPPRILIETEGPDGFHYKEE